MAMTLRFYRTPEHAAGVDPQTGDELICQLGNLFRCRLGIMLTHVGPCPTCTATGAMPTPQIAPTSILITSPRADKSLDTFQTTHDAKLAEYSQNAMRFVQRVINGATSSTPQPCNLIITGPHGVGKTHLANAVWLELERVIGLRGVWTTGVEFFTICRQLYSQFIDDKVRAEEALEAMQQADLLVIDDLASEGLTGAGDVSQNVLRELHRVIDKRYLRSNGSLIITTNVNLQALSSSQSYGARIMRRICEHADVIAMKCAPFSAKRAGDEIPF